MSPPREGREAHPKPRSGAIMRLRIMYIMVNKTETSPRLFAALRRSESRPLSRLRHSGAAFFDLELQLGLGARHGLDLAV